MTDVAKRERREELALTFFNDEPLSLATIAGVLDALDSDYYRVTRRHLAMFSARQGSLHLTLVDAFAIAGGVSTVAGLTLKDFTKLILNKVKSTIEQDQLLGARSKGAKTVRMLVEACRESSANVEIVYQDSTQRIEVRLNRVDAERIWLAEEARAERRTLSHSEAPTGRAIPRLSGSQFEQELGDWAAAAAEFGDDPRQLEDEGNGQLRFVKTLVAYQLEQPDGEQVFRRVVRSLRSRRQEAAASLLERLIESLRPPA